MSFEVEISQSNLVKLNNENVILEIKDGFDNSKIVKIKDKNEIINNKTESKNHKRKMKKKLRAQQRKLEKQIQVENKPENDETINDHVVDVEYIQETVNLDPMYSDFSNIFQAFSMPQSENLDTKLLPEMNLRKKPKDIDEIDDELEEPKEKEEVIISKRQRKKLNQITITELKQSASRPEVVEMHDVTAKDPKLLVLLKSARNTVPVPRHWCSKQKYLQGKRGFEKPPFNLPDFIKRTGIMEMRQALQDKEAEKTLKSKMKEKVRPKLGKIDIDYQKLHDAFFKHQTKPKMTTHGDLYYEGKEFEVSYKDKKPGLLSDELRTALGMPIGPNCNRFPPPWLIHWQRYGPPPSYPHLKIPGLNAPIPEGCAFGYHAGGWGKPPVDETGKPLYGDVFGDQSYLFPVEEEEVDRKLWGEFESDDSESESEESEKEVDDENEIAIDVDGLVTPSGNISIASGIETPDVIELRKRKIEIEKEMDIVDAPCLYTILPEKKVERISGMMASTHVYEINGKKNNGVEVSLDPGELDMDKGIIEARYEESMQERRNKDVKEDFSDMVAEHVVKQNFKRKRKANDVDPNLKSKRKLKDFKF